MTLSKLKRLLIFIAGLLLCLGTVAEAAEDRSFIAMDTVMTIHAPSVAEETLDRCQALAERLESLLSVTLEDSEIARLNRGESVELSEETYALLSFALGIADQTEGAIDISIYPVVKAWGFTTQTYRIPEETELESLLDLVDYTQIEMTGDSIQLPSGMMIDLGAVAKGYLADRMAAILYEAGAESALINLGGNLYCVGKKENGADWRVGIRDPQNENGYFAVCSLSDRAVVTSGGYERYFEQDGKRYSHIFDPATGKPVDNGILSVTVIGESAALCDALSTALTVMGTERACEWLGQRSDCDAVILTDERVYVTEGLRNRFTLYGNYTAYEIRWIGNTTAAEP